jgi:hypothetical protein
VSWNHLCGVVDELGMLERVVGRIWTDMVWIEDWVTSKVNMDTDTIAFFFFNKVLRDNVQIKTNPTHYWYPQLR